MPDAGPADIDQPASPERPVALRGLRRRNPVSTHRCAFLFRPVPATGAPACIQQPRNTRCGCTAKARLDEAHRQRAVRRREARAAGGGQPMIAAKVRFANQSTRRNERD